MDKPQGLTLGPDEKIVWTGKRSFLSFISSAGKGFKILIGGLILVSILALMIAVGSENIEISESCCGFYVAFFVLMIIGVILAKMKYKYAITTKRVFARKGIGGRTINEIPLNQVVNTNYSQGFIGRILGFGNLKFNSAAGADQGVLFKGVKNPKLINQKFKEVNSARAKENRTPQQQTVNVNLAKNRSSSPPPPEPKQAKVIEEEEDLPKLKGKNDKLQSSQSGDEPETKYCKHCGSEIDADSTFCEECGEKL